MGPIEKKTRTRAKQKRRELFERRGGARGASAQLARANESLNGQLVRQMIEYWGCSLPGSLMSPACHLAAAHLELEQPSSE